jgi:PAS domain S-box-containing protein
MPHKQPLTIFLRLFLPVTVLLLVGTFYFGQAEYERELTRLKSQETLNVGLGAGALSRNLDGIYRDLHFLEGHSALHDAVEVPTPQHINHLAEDFLNFSHGKGIYDQVRWIDEAGTEIVRIDQVNGRPVAVSANKLQNKGQRYFFTDTIKLKPGEIFVSPLDLNIEQDKIEVPHKPMIRAATPLVDSRGARRGIVILNYYGRVMLDSFAEVTTDIADHVMLVNRDGYWLKSPKADEEWGFMFKRPDLTLAARAPSAWASIRSADAGQVILPDGLWTWRSVHPLLPGQKSSAGAPDAFVPSRGEVEAKEYVWKTVAHLSRDVLSALQQAIWLKLAGAAATFLGLLGAGAWKLASAWTALASSEAEVRRLNVRLEQKVDERTKELHSKVAELFEENTEREQAQGALRESETRFRNLTEMSSDFYWETDSEHRIAVRTESKRETAESVFMQAASVGKRRWEISYLAPDESGWDLHREMLDAHLPFRDFEITRPRANGTVHCVSISGDPVFDASGKFMGYYGVGSDITERKQAEAEIRRMNTELEQHVQRRTRELQVANSELESFAYSVSHDLRTPLRAIEGFSSLLESEYAAQLDERGKDYFRRIRGGATRMANLIDDLLKLSRISRQKMERESVNLSALVREAAEDLSGAEPERRVEWVIATQVTVHGDRGLLQVAVQNLIANAWKYSSKQESARIEFGIIERYGKPAYFVRDNGAGFDMAYANKLFEAFQRLHSLGDFPGTGIGLATVKRIIHRHGGEVRAEGKVGEGAMFYFTL